MNIQTALGSNATRALTLFNRQKIDATIHEVTALISEMKDGTDKLRDEHDKADIAGYTPENVTLLGDWVEKCQALRDEVNNKTEQAQCALDSAERLDAVQADLQGLPSLQPLASNARERAKVVFAWLLENIPEFFHLVRALGTDVSPEIKAAVQQAADTIRCDPNSQLALPRQASPESQSSQAALNEEVEKLKGMVQELELEARLNEGTHQLMSHERDAKRKECIDLKADVANITSHRAASEDREANLHDQIKHQGRQLARYRSMEANEDLLAELRQENKVLRECKTDQEDKVAGLEKQNAALDTARINLEKERDGLLLQANSLSSETQRLHETASHQARASDMLIRLVSAEHKEESEIWGMMVDRVSQNPTMATQLKIRPWKILPSWSTDLVLAVESDGHSIYATITDIIAILQPGCSVTFLLRRLNALQEALKAHQLFVAVLEMVIGRFADSMADPRLHAMHRPAMCQIAAVVYPANDDRLVAVEQAALAVDPRIASLSHTLRAWNGISPFPLDKCLEYPDQGLVLVGFGNGRSILAVDVQKHGLFWVDEVINNLREAHCQSATGQKLSFPIGDPDTLRWFIRHTKIEYKPQ
ncbi:hypothetical protein BGZ61DRAFT_538052 [Ilyonectria robusta]|uniref:uncharacterized protein n=1 Tax=Ilyonectria robusta TaxID=1079257 RepID=UPI001E8DBA67|nr:uncharacterized protein BGZ61DRAFT_538052 [Ilyonectria robusta]KAH8667882.1 hypothetical protein BGZ61DRAFT_538052 [Ilyonectria robusta]